MSSECRCHTDEWCFYCEMYVPLETENERLKAWIEVVVNSYHHILTHGLTQEGVQLIKAKEAAE